MSGELHSFPADELQVINTRIVLLNNLLAFKHAIWQGFIVATSDHEDSWLFNANLDDLEVVGECTSEVNISMLQGFFWEIECSYCFRVLLEDEKIFGHLIEIYQGSILHLLLVTANKFLHDRLLSIHGSALDLRDSVVLLAAIFLDLGGLLTSCNMSLHLAIHEGLTASRTFELQILDKLFYLTMHFRRWLSISTFRTLPRALLIFDAMATVKDLAVTVGTLFAVLYDTVANITKEM